MGVLQRETPPRGSQIYSSGHGRSMLHDRVQNDGAPSIRPGAQISPGAHSFPSGQGSPTAATHVLHALKTNMIKLDTAKAAKPLCRPQNFSTPIFDS